MPRTVPPRRGLKALALVTATAYATILIYQAVSPRQWPDDGSAEVNNSSTSAYEMTESRRTMMTEKIAITSPVATTIMSTISITDLDDVFITVKTSKRFHNTRLPAIIDTWFKLAENQTWFFTDAEDERLQNLTNGHMINTKCSPTHERRDLCCKTSVEFDTFLKSGKKWFCHFDDDNYVNVPRLLKLLDNYDPRRDWYLGKNSIPKPMEVPRLAIKSRKVRRAKFWFGTGGAGICISRALALKMVPIAGGGKFITACENIKLPDDVTLGYLIEHQLKTKLTVVERFHSHLEPMKFLNKDSFHDQVSLSYSGTPSKNWNVVKIDGFDAEHDPQRFKSIHCQLFPTKANCPDR